MLIATPSLRAKSSHFSAIRSAVARLIVLKSCIFFAVPPPTTNCEVEFCADAVTANAKTTKTNPATCKRFIIPSYRKPVFRFVDFASKCAAAQPRNALARAHRLHHRIAAESNGAPDVQGSGRHSTAHDQHRRTDEHQLLGGGQRRKRRTE